MKLKSFLISVLTAFIMMGIVGIFLLIGFSGWKYAMVTNVLLFVGIFTGVVVFIYLAAPEDND